MLLVDARRLTGPNLFSESPLVVVELALDVPDVLEHVEEVYLAELARMRTSLGLVPDVAPMVRAHRGGAVIAYEAPLDVMLPFTEMSEWAALSACEVLRSRAPLSLEPKRTEIATMLAAEENPQLNAVAVEAAARDLPFLWDDEQVTVGSGPRSVTWPRAQVPRSGDVPWDTLGRIPVALVTGTNGKTTTARLLARMAREAGHRVGSTSSDGVVIGNELVEKGDWTGPAAARTVLRRQDVDVAVLETARGGILRRGLAIHDCDVAAITNVSEDHTGSYGIDDLQAMTRVKAVVARAVRPGGTIVLNARDPKLVSLASMFRTRITFFADMVDAAPLVSPTVIATASAILVDGRELVKLEEVPITFGGAARYNVENALAAVALAQALGFGDDAILRALRGFDPAENPRRGEIATRNGVRVMLDYGHNPAGVRAVLSLVASLRGSGRLTVVTGAAGDRTNHEIAEMARSIANAKPHRIIVRDLPDYLRGRLPGEVPKLFTRALEGLGMQTETVASEVAALETAFEDASEGDFVLVLVLLDRDAVHAYLAS